MALQRYSLDTVLLRRCAPLMERAGMDITTVGGNPDLDDPIAWALRVLGFSTANVETVSDADLSTVGVAYWDAILDLAEVRCLESVAANLSKVSTRVGNLQQQHGELAPRVQKLADTRRRNAAITHQALLTIPIVPGAGSDILLEAL